MNFNNQLELMKAPNEYIFIPINIYVLVICAIYIRDHFKKIKLKYVSFDYFNFISIIIRNTKQ